MIFCNMPFSVAVCVYPTEKFSILSNEGEDRIKKEFLIKFPRMLYVYDGSWIQIGKVLLSTNSDVTGEVKHAWCETDSREGY